MDFLCRVDLRIRYLRKAHIIANATARVRLPTAGNAQIFIGLPPEYSGDVYMP